MLLYNTDGTVSNIVINAIIHGKVSSSLETAPTIQQAFEASASNAIINKATTAGSSSVVANALGFPTSTNTSNLGYTYLSSATVQKTYSTNSYAVLNPTSADLHTRGQINYWITGSTIIPKGVATFTTSSLGLGPANTTAKVSIPVSNFTSLFNSSINNANDIKAFNILAYNGIISTLTNYNEFSSSINGTTSSFVVMYVSASKANMGSVVGNDLYVTLGTTQNSSGTRNGNDSTTNVSGHAAFAAKYPNNTTKEGWVDGVSPKNQ
jgi:hypothetical protein